MVRSTLRNHILFSIALLIGLAASVSPGAAVPMPVIIIQPDGFAPSDQFGDSVATAGDINNDSFDDIIVGARYNDAAGTDAGAVYIFFGGNVPNDIPDLVLTGEAAGDHFGAAVAAGDFNGDGATDLIVGAPRSGAGGFLAGRAYVYLGGPVLDNVPDLVLTGEASLDHFGAAVGTAGGFSSMSYDDFVVGAPNNDGNGFDAGRVYLYHGGAFDNAPDLILSGAQPSDFFGVSVTSAGRFNGDTFDDLIVGAPGADPPNGQLTGAAYIFYGHPSRDATPDLTLSSLAFSDNFGCSVASAGDFDGDSYADVIVGASHLNFGTGRAYVYRGGPSADATADFTLTGVFSSQQFGASVAGVGDFDGDTHDDIAVGAPGILSSGTAGAVYVYFGGPGADDVPDLTFTAADVSGLGYSVAAAGRFNGDALRDIVAGAPGAGAGRAFVFSVDRATATLLSLFECRAIDAGIELRWRVSGAASNLALERADATVGPWFRVEGESRLEDGVSIFVDRTTEPGRTYSYRLVSADPGGAVGVLGTLVATDRALADLAIVSMTPNPVVDLLRVDYTVARKAPVRLSVLDVTGREVAALADGPHAAGRYQAVWNGTNRSRVPAGVYFVALRSSGQTRTRPIVVNR